jgi:formate dehydrogenase subunit beta
LAAAILKADEIGAVLVPIRLPMKPVVMPALVSDPEQLAGMDPLAPAFALNAAKLVSRLTRKPAGSRLAVFLRPCEIRAFVELVKLHQGRTEDVLIVGYDCLGAYSSKAYAALTANRSAAQVSGEHYEKVLVGQGVDFEGLDLAPACRACEHPTVAGADLAVALFGVDTREQVLVSAQTDKGRDMLERLNFDAAQVPSGRDQVIENLIAQRTVARDRMFAGTAAATGSLEKLSAYLAGCVNCYNCRVACPVCYCRECVFVTDVFDHEPVQYLGWARRKGAIKMPTDTLFYHLTRLAHMSTACVGCGQCSNACPNDVPVMELFRTAAQRTQTAFDYQAGRSLLEKPPLTEFQENEYQEVVGIGGDALSGISN